jgi:hypothetical protein
MYRRLAGDLDDSVGGLRLMNGLVSLARKRVVSRPCTSRRSPLLSGPQVRELLPLVGLSLRARRLTRLRMVDRITGEGYSYQQ